MISYLGSVDIRLQALISQYFQSHLRRCKNILLLTICHDSQVFAIDNTDAYLTLPSVITADNHIVTSTLTSTEVSGQGTESYSGKQLAQCQKTPGSMMCKAGNGNAAGNIPPLSQQCVCQLGIFQSIRRTILNPDTFRWQTFCTQLFCTNSARGIISAGVSLPA